ncbi:PREDICTED: uncharacterized protein LOC104803143 [Tarenaya hassleriana]|uniref:uncharacterized protein LOC104803143 n=1 Tax=Tarenaya hassleriana TaxID=28532 RepID=UPI00053C0926|nr:PREDICTED: uncharacterized protein LOC104803143 [Tarenaya hassleriana]
MTTSAFRSTTKRPTPLPKSSTSGDDGESSSSARMSAPRRHRSLSRFSHRRMPDLDAEVTPARNGKFVNTFRGSGFPEISLDDLAVEFFDSFSADSSGISGGERGRSGSRKFGSGGVDNESTVSQRRGRSVSRAALGGGGADPESARQRRSVSRPPTRADAGDSGGVYGSANSGRRRSVSRPPSRGNVGENCGGARSANSRRRSMSRPPARGEAGDRGGDTAIANSGRRRSVSRPPSRGNAGVNGGGAGSANSRRRSVSVVRCRISDSESDVDLIQSSSNRGKLKSYVGGNGQVTGSHKHPASVHRPSLRRSFSQNEIKYHDGYSSHSSAITDDEGKDTHSGKHGTERIIRAVYTQNKAKAKTRNSLGDCDSKTRHDVTSITKDYATKLVESEERKRDLLAEILLEEQRGKELSKIVKGLLTESGSEVSQKPSRPRKRSKDRSRISTCLTDEAEKYIEEFISTIEDTDFSSLDDERSETSSNFGVVKTYTAIPEAAPVETDGVMLPWLQWETSTDSSPLRYLSKSLDTPPVTKSKIWESDSSAQDVTSGRDMSIRSISSMGSCSAVKSSDPGNSRSSGGQRRLKIDVGDYLKQPSNADFVYESWKLRHRISSGSLVMCSRRLLI